MKSNVMVITVAVVAVSAAQLVWAQCSGAKAASTGKAAGCCPLSKPTKAVVVEAEAAETQNLTTEELASLIESGKKVTILDARTGKYDDGRRIPGAAALAAGASKEDVEKLLPAKDGLVVTYCAGVKCPASRKLAQHLAGLGYENVREYPQGIAGWVESGGETVETKKQ